MSNYRNLKVLIAEIEAKNVGITDIALRTYLNTNTVSVLNNQTYTAQGLISLLGRAVGTPMLDDLQAAAAAVPELNWVMQGIVTEGVNLSDPETQAALTDLVTANVLTQSVVDAINNAITVQVLELQEQAGLSHVNLEDITKARGIV